MLERQARENRPCRLTLGFSCRRQVGVTIASVAMAVKQKRAVWLIATLAGLAAIGFGVYVYVGMA